MPNRAHEAHCHACYASALGVKSMMPRPRVLTLPPSPPTNSLPPLVRAITPIRSTALLPPPYPPTPPAGKASAFFLLAQTTLLHCSVCTAAPPPLLLPCSPASTASRDYKGHTQGQGLLPFASSPRSRALLFIHASALLLLTPCRHRSPPPITGAPPVSSTSPSLGWPSTNNFLQEKMPRTEGTTTFPWPLSASRRQASPVVLPLHRCHLNDRPCPCHFSEP
jgi:hypothetical protein